MAVNIGPRIGIDGEAQFRKEISNIIQQQKTLASELKAVTSAFDKNDKSEEALTAQAKVLNQQIQVQQQRLEQLKKGLSSASQKFGDADTRTLQWKQSVNEATAQLNRMKSQLSGLENGVEDVGDALKDASDSALSFGDILGAGALIEGTKAIVGAFGDAVESTKEYRKIMASLETSSQAAGYTAEQTSETFRQLYGVLGDDQTAATATANLQAVGLSQEQLTGLTDAAIGAWARYGDSIPIDSLSEAINETIKTGTVTGTFADVLNWAGQSEDDFNAKLSEASNESERANMVLQAMASQGLAQAGEAWQQNNQDLVDANQAQAEFNENMADLAEQISPIATAIKENFSEMLGTFSDSLSVVDFGGLVSGAVSMQEFSAQISEAISSITSEIAANLPEILQAGTQIVASIGLGIIQAVPQVMTAAKGLIDNLTAGIKQNLPSIISSGVESLVSFTGGLKENIGSLVDSALEMIQTLADGIIASLPALIENVPLIVSNVANVINENAPKLIASAAELIGKLVIGLIQNIPVIIQNMPQIIKAIVDSIAAFNWVSLGSSVIKGIATGIKNLAGSFRSTMSGTFKEAMQAAMDAIKGFPNQAIQWGRDMISGFVSGILDSIGSVVSAASSVANTITSYLHFSRPDKGSLRQYEQWMPDMINGMAKGIRENAWQLEDALNAATSNLQTNVNIASLPASGGMSMGAVNITINAAPGMDVNALADAVAYKIQAMAQRKAAVW